MQCESNVFGNDFNFIPPGVAMPTPMCFKIEFEQIQNIIDPEIIGNKNVYPATSFFLT